MKFLFKNISQDPLQYLALALVFIIAFILLYLFRFDTFHEQLVVYSVAIFYIAWAVYHHHRRGDLHFSIIAEYLLFAILAILIATFTLI